MRLFKKSNYRVKELKNGGAWRKVIFACAILVIFAIALTAIFIHKGNTFTEEQAVNSGDAKDNPTAIDYKNGENVPIIDGIYLVETVIDGDTFIASRNGETKTVRLIGVNTPEVDSPYTSTECYGNEASAFLKDGIEGEHVTLLADPSQDDVDIYGRSLRYASLEDGIDVGAIIIYGGFSKEYTYDTEYYNQSTYRELEADAKDNKRGIWQEGYCQEKKINDSSDSEPIVIPATVIPEKKDCNIKGNISYNNGKKIYHVPGQKYYDETIINESVGERWFCSEEEAIAAGWRKSKE